MTKARVVEVRLETEQEKKLDNWFSRQVLRSPDALEAAARTILGLITALLGILLGVLAVADTPLPSYFWLPLVRPAGVGAVMALLVALLGALATVYPQRIGVSRDRPDDQARAFNRLVARKARWLSVAVIAFGVALAALGAIVAVALLLAV